MIATTLVQNGAKVYITSRKEKQLKEVGGSLCRLSLKSSDIPSGLGRAEQERAWLVPLPHIRSRCTWYLTITTRAH